MRLSKGMKNVAGIIVSLFLLAVVALLCVNAVARADTPRPVFYVQAIKLDGRTGEELNRYNVKGPYESVEDCSAAQQTTGAQRPEVHPDGLTITVFDCVVLQGGTTT